MDAAAPLLLEDATLALYTASEGCVAGGEIFTGLCLEGVTVNSPGAGEPRAVDGAAVQNGGRGAGAYTLEAERWHAPDPASLSRVAQLEPGVPLVAVLLWKPAELGWWVKRTLQGARLAEGTVAPGAGRVMGSRLSLEAGRSFECAAAGAGDVTPRAFGSVWWTDGRERVLAYRWDFDGDLERLDAGDTRLVMGQGGANDWEVSISGDVSLAVEGGELRAKSISTLSTRAEGERCEVTVDRERVMTVTRTGALLCPGLAEQSPLAGEADELAALVAAETAGAFFSVNGARAATVAEVASF